MKKRHYSFIIIATVITLGIVEGPTLFSHAENINISPTVLYKVTQVTDGDTIHTIIDGEDVTIRMKGMDTPETKDPRKPVQCFGKEASQKTKELLEGKLVHLVADKIDTTVFDKYGRALMYVYRDDGLFVNEYLLKEGYAHEYTYDKPYEMQKAFKKLEKDAKKEKKGLWGSLCLQK